MKTIVLRILEFLGRPSRSSPGLRLFMAFGGWLLLGWAIWSIAGINNVTLPGALWIFLALTLLAQSSVLASAGADYLGRFSRCVVGTRVKDTEYDYRRFLKRAQSMTLIGQNLQSLAGTQEFWEFLQERIGSGAKITLIAGRPRMLHRLCWKTFVDLDITLRLLNQFCAGLTLEERDRLIIRFHPAVTLSALIRDMPSPAMVLGPKWQNETTVSSRMFVVITKRDHPEMWKTLRSQADALTIDHDPDGLNLEDAIREYERCVSDSPTNAEIDERIGKSRKLIEQLSPKIGRDRKPSNHALQPAAQEKRRG